MSNPKITLIVPIYNTLKFLGRCLNSIKNQTFKDFEVILVNDGSPDDSELFCKEFIKSDSRFILKSKQNGGLASTRNYGMKYAKGDYIGFIDSDDYISLDYCMTLYNKAKKYDVDILDFGLTYIKDNIETKRFSAFSKNKLIFNEDILEYLKHTSSNKILWYVNKFFRRKFLEENNIDFDGNILFGDDSIFNLKCFYNAKFLYSIDIPLYYYVYNPMSITQVKFKENLLNKVQIQFDERLKFHKENVSVNSQVYYKDISRNYIEHLLFTILSNICDSPGIDRVIELKKIRSSRVYKFSFANYTPSGKITMKMKLMVFLFKKKYFIILNTIMRGN